MPATIQGQINTGVTEEHMNDSRFNKILDISKELKGLSEHINKLLGYKLNNLIGPISRDPVSEDYPDPDCWVDAVIIELNSAFSSGKDAVSKLENL